MIETLDADHVRLARAKGLSPRRVLFRHVLRNALIPVTTVVALDFAAVSGGPSSPRSSSAGRAWGSGT